MNEINENFFENNMLFKFNTYSCEVKTDIIHTAPGDMPLHEYKIIADTTKPITLAYAPKKGLIRVNEKGVEVESDLLGTFISLYDKKEKDLIKFISNNGFIFPINDKYYESIKKEDLDATILRLKYTVELLSEISSTKKDYHKMVSLIIKIMQFQRVNIKTDLMQEPYMSHHYEYIDILQAVSGVLSEKRKMQEFQSNVFTIEDDSIFPNYEISIDEYNECIENTSIGCYKNILQLYVNNNFQGRPKKLTDVLFHSLKDCKSVESFISNENILNNISEEFKNAIIDISAYIVGEEINANLNRIHPMYDTKKMKPSWVIDDLLSALYFSIFYLKPDLELYRQCANPRCSKYFLVSATSNKKIYCSTECCNRVTQYNYRRRKNNEK